MNLQIRTLCDADIDDLVSLSIVAWEPVFHSFQQVLGSAVYQLIWPDWRSSQSEGVAGVFRDREKYTVWVAELDGRVVGYVAYELDAKDKTGRVQLLAVHPDHQNLGIGTELNTFALAKMKASGMRMASVETGGDPGHAPARRSYEKAGYTALPLVRYFKDL